MRNSSWSKNYCWLDTVACSPAGKASGITYLLQCIMALSSHIVKTSSDNFKFFMIFTKKSVPTVNALVAVIFCRCLCLVLFLPLTFFACNSKSSAKF